jgi:acetoin utilization deacetylase AcuC-like enzyme
MIDADTVASPGSYEAALHAAGGAAMGAERLLGGERFAFCGLRPPGHHAEASRAMGFCLFNNAAVAAAHALATGGADRVLILDWDVHHGNGTQAIFADSDRVLYASIHQSPLYPGTGPADYLGDGPGEGYTVNLPVPPGSGSEEFLALVQHVVAPIARSFAPDLIVISAGFDAHRRDPLANLQLVDTDFAWVTKVLMEVADKTAEGRLISTLEGGYDLEGLTQSAAAHVMALMHG